MSPPLCKRVLTLKYEGILCAIFFFSSSAVVPVTQNELDNQHFSICRKNDEWYVLNDSNVSKFDINNNKSVLFKNGYILIYKKI